MDTLLRWIDALLTPVFNVGLALLLGGLVVWAVGQDPQQVLTLLVRGAFGSRLGWSYTLYYATTFVFTGLAVAVALHAGLFNIGGEGQAMMGGLGVALAALALGDQAPVWLTLPVLVVAAMAGGLLWAAVPAALQAWRGSHVVITTIMGNFIASALLAWVLVVQLKEPGNMTIESRAFGPGARVPGMHDLLAVLGIDWPRSPLNLSLLLALGALAAVGWGLWRTRAGYALRVVGHAPMAARYAGIPPARHTVGAMLVSGALAGLLGVNEVAGVHGRLLLDFVNGAGFAGIAVALIGRNHPVGIGLTALLFGALYQGGAEVAFEVPGFSRDMVVTLQGLIVLCAGGLAHGTGPLLARWRPARRTPPSSRPQSEAPHG